ncbi:MAG: hypothetical protein Q7S33_04025 [Nanoarchaeota archaeon]|nr:hypothetical protein [Nanoarchaeota archaeon]
MENKKFDEYQRKQTRNLARGLKNLAVAGALCGAVFYAGYCGLKKLEDYAEKNWNYAEINKTDLTKEDFQKAEWKLYGNNSGMIWSCYTFEDIPHTSNNWYAYEKEVRAKNKGNLEGQILLPDLDKNGIVGKQIEEPKQKLQNNSLENLKKLNRFRVRLAQN